MGENSAISWTTHTFNPWWGCAHVSPGCVSCYAESFAKRVGQDVWGAKGERRIFGDAHWKQPLRWNARAEEIGQPALVFCASMADVFEEHPAVVEERLRLWELVAATPFLRWQLLTKRPENVRDLTPATWWSSGQWPNNVWVGASAEDQQRLDERIVPLLLVPAPVRFLSCEPLLGPLQMRGNWHDYLHRTEPWHTIPQHSPGCGTFGDGSSCASDCPHPEQELLSWRGIDWVIVGGESGNRVRPMDPEWARSILHECRDAGVPFFAKQGSGRRSGQQYDLPPEVWVRKELPVA